MTLSAFSQDTRDGSSARARPRDVQSDGDLHVDGKITTTGNVGVGTTDPQSPLHVFRATDGTTLRLSRAARTAVQQYQDVSFFDGTLEDSRIRVESFTGGNHGLAFWSYYSGALREVMRLSNGKVGIGTVDPQDALHVKAMANGEGVTITAQTVYSLGMKFIADSSDTRNRNWAIYTNHADYGDFVIRRSIGNTGDPYGTLGTPALSISRDGHALFAGNIGAIGAIYATGNIEAGGTIYAKFQDVAEWVPATETIAAGSIVVVAARNHVSPSTEPYDTRVAGVVSAQPGIALGEAGDSKVLVATTGRLKVRVDASSGSIREGDILVSSPIKGTAMKSEPLVLSGRKFHQPGTVIGKALEPLESGTGEILVLLSMQ